jgi:hypothetical protein
MMPDKDSRRNLLDQSPLVVFRIHGHVVVLRGRKLVGRGHNQTNQHLYSYCKEPIDVLPKEEFEVFVFHNRIRIPE